MLDPRLFRTELDFVTAQLARRNFAFDAEGYIALETRRKDVQIKTPRVTKSTQQQCQSHWTSQSERRRCTTADESGRCTRR